jgi:hypothetical protein
MTRISPRHSPRTRGLPGFSQRQVGLAQAGFDGARWRARLLPSSVVECRLPMWSTPSSISDGAHPDRASRIRDQLPTLVLDIRRSSPVSGRRCTRPRLAGAIARGVAQPWRQQGDDVRVEPGANWRVGWPRVVNKRSGAQVQRDDGDRFPPFFDGGVRQVRSKRRALGRETVAHPGADVGDVTRRAQPPKVLPARGCGAVDRILAGPLSRGHVTQPITSHCRPARGLRSADLRYPQGGGSPLQLRRSAVTMVDA